MIDALSYLPNDDSNDETKTGLSILDEMVKNIPTILATRIELIDHTIPKEMQITLVLGDIDNSLGFVGSIDMTVREIIGPGKLAEVNASVHQGLLQKYRKSIIVFDGVRDKYLDEYVYERADDEDMRRWNPATIEAQEMFVWTAHQVASAMAA